MESRVLCQKANIMEETLLWRKIRYCTALGLVSAFWCVMIFQPLYAWYLWKYWWLRPLIIWYSPWTIVASLLFVILPVLVVLLSLTKGDKNKVLTSLYLKFQAYSLYLVLRLLHGFEMHGLHNLPEAGALIVYYHAPILPVDNVFMFCYIYLKFGRLVGGSVDVNWHQTRIFRPFIELNGYTSTRQGFIEGLKKGRWQSVAPGGAYEAMFSRNYSLEWRSRIGFAKAAKDAGVPVVPMFTTNLQHSMPLPEFNRSDLMLKLYALIKTPL